MSLIVVGFIFALIGFSGIREYGTRGILGWSIAGLLINGCLLGISVVSLHALSLMRAQKTLQAITVNPPADFVHYPEGMRQEEWKTHEIDVVRIKEVQQDIPILTFNAQVPLLPRAIQVKLMGAEERETELRRDLRAILAGIDGSTNW